MSRSLPYCPAECLIARCTYSSFLARKLQLNPGGVSRLLFKRLVVISDVLLHHRLRQLRQLCTTIPSIAGGWQQPHKTIAISSFCFSISCQPTKEGPWRNFCA